MSKPAEFEPACFLPYSEALRHRPPRGALRIDVSSEGDDPFHLLSPMHAHGAIPVPGMPGTVSDSVEGIWQGLKVIRGKTAPRFFRGGGKKRGGKPAGHRFGDAKRLLDLEAARRKIYIPAYEWILEHRVPEHVIESLRKPMREGIRVYVYDRASNGSITKNLPLAHASVLARWLNRTMPGS